MHSFFTDIRAQIPLIQAPMAGAQDAELAIAVAQAGGVGSIPCAASTPQDVRAAANSFQDATTGPLNLNFFCHKVVARDPQRETLWLHELKPFYDDLSLIPEYAKTGVHGALDADMVDVVCEIKPAIVSFHFGLPATPLIDRIRATGAKIIATATTIEEALFLEENGCDGVIAQSQAAGGHQGVFLPTDTPMQLPTMDLVPRVAAAVNIPVIAAGGIADAATIKAVMAAGAAAVQIGTRFLKSPESKITPLQRRILEGNEDRKTAITNVFTGRPARGFINKLVRDIGPINANVQAFPLAISALAPLKLATAGTEDFVSLWAGESWKTGDAKPAGEIVKDLAQAFTHAE
jgi:nitronate monooxygenase